MKNTPAFQFYPGDVIGDPELVHWKLDAVGAYLLLLCHLWANGGELELNLNKFRRIFNVSTTEKARKVWQKIERKFTVTEAVIKHDGLLREMQKQAESRLRRQAAARARWDNQAGRDANAYAMQRPSTSSSSSTSTSTSIATSVRESKEPLALDGHDLSEVVLAWAKSNGMDERQIRDDHVAAWQGALDCHGKSACLEYIGKVKATSPGWIISRMNKDAANGAETMDRSATGRGNAGHAGKVNRYDGSDDDWAELARKYNHFDDEQD